MLILLIIKLLSFAMSSSNHFCSSELIDRSHTVIFVKPNTRILSAILRLPNIGNNFYFAQIWISFGEGKTIEFGMRKDKGVHMYESFIFQTDDNYRSGYFNDELVIWTENYKTICTTKTYKLVRYKPGSIIEIMFEIKLNKVYMWINDDYIGEAEFNKDIENISLGLETEKEIIPKENIIDYNYILFR